MPFRLRGRTDRLWRFFAIAIVFLIVVLFYADWRAFQNTAKEVAAARLLQQQTDAVLSLVTDAEAGARGYLLTGSPVYLASYKKSALAIPGQLDQLSRAAAVVHLGGAASSARRQADSRQIDFMRSLILDKLAELKRAIDTRDEQGAEAGLALMRSAEDKLTMDEVRAAGKMLLSGEYLGLYELQKAWQEDAGRSRVIVLVGSFALVLLLFRMGWAVDGVVEEREEFARRSEDSRQLLETTLASIGDAVVVTDSAGIIRFMNPVAEKLTGWSMSAARQQPLSGVFRVLDDVTHQTLENPFRPLQGQNPAEHLNQHFTEHPLLISREGTERPIENSSSPIRDEHGHVLGFVLVFRDITARRAAERDLERWKQIFSGAGFGMFLADSTTGEIIDVNPTFAGLHGYSVDELLGTCLHALVPEESAGSVSLALQVANENGRNMFESRQRRRDGTTFPSLIDVTRFQNGRTTLLAGYCSDITERKRFQDALKESEERFRTLASALPQLIWSTDAEGRIEYVNQVWIAYAGWKSQDEPRKYLHLFPWYDLIHPEDRDLYFTRWQGSLQSGATFEVQIRLRRSSDASYRWFLCRAVSVRDRKGRISRWLGGCTDTQRQMEDALQLQIANQALRQSNSDLEQFAYAASHDLQEPLRMVSIYSQLLHEEYGPRLDGQALSYIDFAINGARRMSSLLTALLRYSRVSDISPRIAPHADSSAALSAALLNLSTIVKDTRAVVESCALPAVQVSEVHLVQLFQNLIGNALKYRKEQYPPGESLTVRISTKPQGAGKWLFSVSDNGIGIEPEYLTHIFGIFKRLHNSSVEGTGIGLALCQKIVERAGGRIWAESEPGKGSTFLFTLQGVETGEYARAHHNSAGGR